MSMGINTGEGDEYHIVVDPKSGRAMVEYNKIGGVYTSCTLIEEERIQYILRFFLRIKI